jgi:hypothetical protein
MAKWSIPDPVVDRKIFLLTRLTSTPLYDVVNSMVVCAVNEAEARAEASLKAMDEGPFVWLNDTTSTCDIIPSYGEAQVVCVDAMNG